MRSRCRPHVSAIEGRPAEAAVLACHQDRRQRRWGVYGRSVSRSRALDALDLLQGLKRVQGGRLKIIPNAFGEQAVLKQMYVRESPTLAIRALLKARGAEIAYHDPYLPQRSACSAAPRKAAQSSPAFVREPEGNGCVERFIRTLKENLLWVRRFATIEDLRQALTDWGARVIPGL